ncbi:MAG: glycoside hydrolase family 65 protein [Elusimicrobia bacterium]|nr:glycoside hydrolase family 65 protein [Elusimicrobiota bacterium]
MKKSADKWKISYAGYNPAKEKLRETLCGLGNGYLGIRACSPEHTASFHHYPGIYISGLYNRLKTSINGKTIVNEDMVNCPNCLFMTFKIGDGDWFTPGSNELINFHQELDMKTGLLTRELVFQDADGKKTSVKVLRAASMANPHLLAMKYSITPQNYNDKITVRTMLDGRTRNMGVDRYKSLNSQHWKIKDLGALETKGAYLFASTSSTKVNLFEISKTKIFRDEKEILTQNNVFIRDEKAVIKDISFSAKKRNTYHAEKIVFIYASKTADTENPTKLAQDALKNNPRFDICFENSKKAWESLWQKADMEIKGDVCAQKLLRLHTFHILQTASPHTAKIDAAIPARGLYGEAYRGHIFWDEIFVMPFYDSHFPDITKTTVLYRYNRLKTARAAAKKAGYKGAMFPWQSASSGSEETQIIHLNPLSGKWGDDHSHLQRHISFAIAYNLWRHFQQTYDLDFLISYSAEVLLSIAQFVASLAVYDKKDGRYHTHNLMGPDEFHEKLPDSKTFGLTDNAYSNFIIVWILLAAKESISLLPQADRKRIFKKIGLKDADFPLWQDITEKMNIIFNEDEIISQFDGYFKLKEVDYKKYRRKYKNIHRMDRILKAEGKSPDDYKIAKQADVLMIFYLFNIEEAREIFSRLGYEIDKELLAKNYEYYVKRTTHGSTLSKLVHCSIAHQAGKGDIAQKWFKDVLKSDFHDTQGGTTPEGVHIGVMGGSLNIVLQCFAGIAIKNDEMVIAPSLPKKWKQLEFNLSYRGREMRALITKHDINLQIIRQKDDHRPFKVRIEDTHYFPFCGENLTVPLATARQNDRTTE